MTAPPTANPLGLLDGASVDAPVDNPRGQIWDSNGRGSRNWRRSFGWSVSSAPVALLLLAGMAFGPQGVNLLSPAALSLLDSVVPVALATLGVVVGLGMGDLRAGDRRVFVAACLDAAVTTLVVSAGIAVVLLARPSAIVVPFWTLAVASGICAATSLTLPTGNPLEPRSVAARVTELGVLFPIVMGGFVLAWLRAGSFVGALELMAQASGVTLALAAAGWLLLTRVSSETEERVFAVAALLLVGGVADALSLSAVFGGLVAGVFWRYAGRQPHDTISRDVSFVQHPLLVLVLLVAGARAELTSASLGLAMGYLLLRLVGKLAGGILARRALGVRAPRDLGLHVLPPGAFGVAFALNAVAIVGADASALLAAVVLGTIGSEFVALLLPPRRVGE